MFSSLSPMRHGFFKTSLAALCVVVPAQTVLAQHARTYQEVKNWAQLPAGTTWQDTMAVDVDSRGDIYSVQRTPMKVWVLSSKGKFLRSWDTGDVPGLHGLRIDRSDNVWITSRGLHQVFKFTRNGKLQMTLGTRGVPGDNDSKTSLNGPADVAVARNGNIFVADGESSNTRIVKFAPDGKFLASWGTKGTGPGQLMTPHSIVLDSAGRLLVANRGNKRIEIFNQDGGYLGQIQSNMTPYGLWVGRDGIIYIADGTKPIGSLTVLNMRNNKILWQVSGLVGSHMVTVDRRGAVYVAEVSGTSLRKFVRTK